MQIRHFLVFVCLLTLVVGCNNPPIGYISKEHTRNRSAGYEEIAIDSLTYQVVYESGGESSDLTERYALFRAAELTLEKGFDHFVLLESNPSSISGSRTLPFGPGGSGQVYGFVLYTAVKTVRLGKGNAPEGVSSFDARSMVSTMGPTINRAKVDR
jgi:hypothetical protein